MSFGAALAGLFAKGTAAATTTAAVAAPVTAGAAATTLVGSGAGMAAAQSLAPAAIAKAKAAATAKGLSASFSKGIAGAKGLGISSVKGFTGGANIAAKVGSTPAAKVMSPVAQKVGMGKSALKVATQKTLAAPKLAGQQFAKAALPGKSITGFQSAKAVTGPTALERIQGAQKGLKIMQRAVRGIEAARGQRRRKSKPYEYDKDTKPEDRS
tara:strand:- start:1188 stop:1823 length:636 start_codon:yes stop_codon:yes gene_type:complete